jgi:hypothetical protein
MTGGMNWLFWGTAIGLGVVVGIMALQQPRRR